MLGENALFFALFKAVTEGVFKLREGKRHWLMASCCEPFETENGMLSGVGCEHELIIDVGPKGADSRRIEINWSGGAKVISIPYGDDDRLENFFEAMRKFLTHKERECLAIFLSKVIGKLWENSVCPLCYVPSERRSYCAECSAQDGLVKAFEETSRWSIMRPMPTSLAQSVRETAWLKRLA